MVDRLPHWTQSIRFRLSFMYALAMFTSGSILIGGVYVWQYNQLERPQLEVEAQFVPTIDGRIRTFDVVRVEELSEFTKAQAYRQSLEELRKGSLAGLGLLFLVSFGTSWWMAGWALGPVSRMTRVARDITASDLSRRIALPGPEDELKGLADSFDAMLDRLETGFEDQRRFVQDASHELRNPLAVARTNLDLALSDPDASTVELRRAAEVAQRSAERMSALVDDLLVQARSGVPEFTPGDVDLGALVTETVQDHRAGAGQHGVTLQVAAPLVPLMVRGDAAALRRALANLLSNAVKAAPPETTVDVTVVEDGGEAMVSVTDAGPGLTEDEQRLAFERFWRGATSGNGSGLGLSIVRHVLERHGGSVAVVSEPGVGSTFRLRLPIGCGRSPSGNYC
jgi:signal transduction histidine kinase